MFRVVLNFLTWPPRFVMSVLKWAPYSITMVNLALACFTYWLFFAVLKELYMVIGDVEISAGIRTTTKETFLTNMYRRWRGAARRTGFSACAHVEMMQSTTPAKLVSVPSSFEGMARHVPLTRTATAAIVSAV